MGKYRVFKDGETWGQDLEDFLNDPTPSLYVGYHQGPGTNIEAVQGRCWASLARLITLLAEKGVINLEEALKVVDVDHDMRRYKISEQENEY
jgi:hypothetical protein